MYIQGFQFIKNKKYKYIINSKKTKNKKLLLLDFNKIYKIKIRKK